MTIRRPTTVHDNGGRSSSFPPDDSSPRPPLHKRWWKNGSKRRRNLSGLMVVVVTAVTMNHSPCLSLSFQHPPPPPPAPPILPSHPQQQPTPPTSSSFSSFRNRRQVLRTIITHDALRLALGVTSSLAVTTYPPVVADAEQDDDNKTNRPISITSTSTPVPMASPIQHPFSYTPEWTGTHLPLRSLQEAVAGVVASVHVDPPTTTQPPPPPPLIWPMGRWPDPILRRPAEEVHWRTTTTTPNDNDDEDDHALRTTTSPVPLPILQQACVILQRTAQFHGAVGLAAQQCGINARLIYLQGPNGGVWINPRIVGRSPESHARVWNEQCLVLPPTWTTATVLRDDWIDVEYYEGPTTTTTTMTKSSWVPWVPRQRRTRLYGEASRCFQHEYDHDRGILVTDHVGLEELESDTMRDIETIGHEQRQAIAFTRHLDEPLTAR